MKVSVMEKKKARRDKIVKITGSTIGVFAIIGVITQFVKRKFENKKA